MEETQKLNVGLLLSGGFGNRFSSDSLIPPCFTIINLDSGIFSIFSNSDINSCVCLSRW